VDGDSTSAPFFYPALDSASAHSTESVADFIHMVAGGAPEILGVVGPPFALATLDAYTAHATEPVLRPVLSAAESTHHKTQTPFRDTLNVCCQTAAHKCDEDWSGGAARTKGK
jgi:hypothetical protein